MLETAKAIRVAGQAHQTAPKHFRGILILMICAALVFIGTSFWPIIYNETEGQYAGAAHEMLENGTWLVPTNDGIPRLQKPPIVYWILRLSMMVFGQNEFAARLPNALATLGWIFLTYLIGRRIGGRQLGLFAAAIFGSMFGLFIFSHLIMPEPFLGLCLSLTFWSMICAWQEPDRARRWFVWSWIFMGLGVMTKGLHGALIPLAVAGVTALFNRDTRQFWRGLWSWRGWLLFLAIVIPWYATIAIKFPGFLADHFINEQAGHLVDKRWPPDCERVPLGIFWLQHLIYFWPWILFFPAAFWTWRQKPYPLADRIPARMLWGWILMVVAAVMFSSRQDYYTMITWGALAAWLALPWTRPQSIPRGLFTVPFVILAVVGAAVIVGSLLVTPEVLHSSVSVTPTASRTDLFKSVSGFSGGAWRSYLQLFGVTGLAFLMAGLVGIWLMTRRQIAVAGLVLSALMIFPFLMIIRGYTLSEDYFSLAKIGLTVNKVPQAEDLVVCEGEPHLNASLFFYIDRRIHWVGARPDGDFAQRALRIGAELYLAEPQFIRQWRSARRVYFITETASLPAWQQKLGATPAQMTVLARSGTRVVIANH